MNDRQLAFARSWTGPHDERFFNELYRLGEADPADQDVPETKTPPAVVEGVPSPGPLGRDRRDSAVLVPTDTTPTATLVEALDAVERLLRRFVVFARPEAIVAVVLWVAHTYALEFADATPYLNIASPEKGSGKTRLLELLQHLAHACAGIVITPTASTIYRSLEATPGATLLLDELDAVFRDRSDRYEEVRAVINAGYRRGATVPRSVPGPKNTWVVKHFPVFGAKALAGIGKLPDTIVDRGIPIRMLKRKRSESIEKFRDRLVRTEVGPIIAALVAALAATPPAYDAAVPEALPDRAADVWEPLFAIADVAGGNWPPRARRAAVILHASREEDDSQGLRLLADLRLAFDGLGVDRVFTADLIEVLKSDEEGPWASEKVPFTPHRLARLLKPFEIASKQIRIGERSLKGYERAWFVDSWERYLSASLSSADAKHRNTERERSFDVSDPRATNGHAAIDGIGVAWGVDDEHWASWA